MSGEFERQVFKLRAAIHAVVTTMAGETIRSPRGIELSADAYSRGPVQAVSIVAQLTARRLDQYYQRLGDKKSDTLQFPREELLERLRLRGRAAPDCIDFLEEFIGSVPSKEGIDELILLHGLIAFIVLVQICNEVGRMLVDVDPSLASLGDLFADEALAGELVWLDWPDTGWPSRGSAARTGDSFG